VLVEAAAGKRETKKKSKKEEEQELSLSDPNWTFDFLFFTSRALALFARIHPSTHPGALR